MTHKDQSAIDRLLNALQQIIGKLLNPNQPVPAPVPVRVNPQKR